MKKSIFCLLLVLSCISFLVSCYSERIREENPSDFDVNLAKEEDFLNLDYAAFVSVSPGSVGVISVKKEHPLGGDKADASAHDEQKFRAYSFKDYMKHNYMDSLVYIYSDGVFRSLDYDTGAQFEVVSDQSATQTNHDFDIVAFNGKIINIDYYGDLENHPPELLLPIFNQRDFEIYSDFQARGIYKSVLTVGDYEDEIKLDFEGFNSAIRDATAVLGDIKPVSIEPVDPSIISSFFKETAQEKRSTDFPQYAFRLSDTDIYLLEFYTTMDDQTFHVFAVSTPENSYKEVFRHGKPIERFDVEPQGYDPMFSKVEYVGLNRNNEYCVLFQVAGKGLAYFVDFFKFQVSVAASTSTDISSLQSNENEERDVLITVKKEELAGGLEREITDQTQVQKILALVEGMMEGDFAGPPPTGGTIMTVLVTRDGVIEEYSFFEDEVAGFCLAKNHQHPDARNVWFFADAGAFSYLMGLL